MKENDEISKGRERPKGRGKHPNSLKNLKVQKAGEPPPPGVGRKPGSLSYKELFAEVLVTELPDKTISQLINGPNESLDIPAIFAGCRSALQVILVAMTIKASKGNVQAAEFVFNRAFGKESEKMELTGKDGERITADNSVRLSEVCERAALLVSAFSSRQQLSNETLAEK